MNLFDTTPYLATTTTTVAPRLVYAVDATNTTNADVVTDLARLGYLPEPVLDPTFGVAGGMWQAYRPGQVVTSDLKPGVADLIADFTRLPFEDDSFGSCVFDPPYRLAGTVTGEEEVDDRFGIRAGYTPARDVHALMMAGVTEMARVVRPNGYVIVKCQAQISSGHLVHQPYLVVRHAEELGLTLVDELHFMPPGGGRPQPAGRRQLHARRNFSTFLVLRKPPSATRASRR